jgi:predicted LPLAT superfamily acyltransferase
MVSWRKIPEAGTVLGLRLLVLLARLFGRRVAGWILYVVALDYAIVRPTARRASRDYLRRVGQPATFANVVRHVHTFARVSLDRLFFLTGRWGAFRFEQRNHDMLVQIAETGRGVVLLGAHLGSFEVMRCRAKDSGLPINIVADFSNAERVNGVLRSLAPAIDTRLIALGDDPVAAMLAIRAAIDRGELVAILGDRHPDPAVGQPGPPGPPGPSVKPGPSGPPGPSVKPDSTRVVVSRFLGADAAFPAGPWLLAHALRCPVYFVAGIYTPPDHYALHFECLADEVKLDRRDRAGSLAQYSQRYASMLETYVRAAPLNWFNFFDFWSPALHGRRADKAEPADEQSA